MHFAILKMKRKARDSGEHQCVLGKHVDIELLHDRVFVDPCDPNVTPVKDDGRVILHDRLCPISHRKAMAIPLTPDGHRLRFSDQGPSGLIQGLHSPTPLIQGDRGAWQMI